ncbi:thiamine-phosphate kinase [Candidatus Halobeggiatoa sp. HSG11]|nr:thiamine-phosphate kinase [Candidatus Halobeggiatoa sp. HSG11]
MSEFDLIYRYFATKFPQRSDVEQGIGDDAAICNIPPNMQLVTSIDTLVAGVHFPLITEPEDIGYKALAVNLSDMAAMGATPVWMTLALTCPEVDTIWLQKFSEGLAELAQIHQVSLIGGDTTRGPLTITIQIAGLISFNTAIKRNGAKPGDNIYVTGTLGDAGLGLAAINQQVTLSKSANQYAISRLNRPTPRLQESHDLLGIAHSAIDISDGLLADLGHILEASNVGASLQIDNLPLSTVLCESVPYETALNLALSAGDDYELCFTTSQTLDSYTCIGKIEADLGLRCLTKEGDILTPKMVGYQHFF